MTTNLSKLPWNDILETAISNLVTKYRSDGEPAYQIEEAVQSNDIFVQILESLPTSSAPVNSNSLKTALAKLLKSTLPKPHNYPGKKKERWQFVLHRLKEIICSRYRGENDRLILSLNDFLKVNTVTPEPDAQLTAGAEVLTSSESDLPVRPTTPKDTVLYGTTDMSSVLTAIQSVFKTHIDLDDDITTFMSSQWEVSNFANPAVFTDNLKIFVKQNLSPQEGRWAADVCKEIPVIDQTALLLCHYFLKKQYGSSFSTEQYTEVIESTYRFTKKLRTELKLGGLPTTSREVLTNTKAPNDGRLDLATSSESYVFGNPKKPAPKQKDNTNHSANGFITPEDMNFFSNPESQRAQSSPVAVAQSNYEPITPEEARLFKSDDEEAIRADNGTKAPKEKKGELIHLKQPEPATEIITPIAIEAQNSKKRAVGYGTHSMAFAFSQTPGANSSQPSWSLQPSTHYNWNRRSQKTFPGQSSEHFFPTMTFSNFPRTKPSVPLDFKRHQEIVSVMNGELPNPMRGMGVTGLTSSLYFASSQSLLMPNLFLR